MYAQQVLEERTANAGGEAVTIDDLTLLLFGHAAFQYFHAGSALNVFRLLEQNPLGSTDEELRMATGLAAHPLRCLLFGLRALRLIVKSGDRYANAPLISEMMATGTWTVVEDTLALEADVVYLGQADFVESLRQNTNVGLRRIPGTGADLYQRLSENPDMQRVFYRYMSSWSRMANAFLLKTVPFSRWSHVLDVGGGDATTAIAIAQANPGARVTVLELPGNRPVADARIAAAGLTSRVRVLEGDMFTEPFPRDVTCCLFMHQLVIWPLEAIRDLLHKAYDALQPGGSVVICSSISNDEGDGPVMAALDSVYFVSIPATRGMIYSWRDYETAMTAAGFAGIERHPFGNWTPHGALVGHKPHAS